MPKDSRKDISSLTGESAEYMMISLLADRINVLIVGGGRAGYIKAKAFLGSGANVTIVSEAFCNEVIELKDNTGDDCTLASKYNLNLVEDVYRRGYILDKHLIVIATNNKAVNSEIRKHCDEMSKIYLNCEDYRQGLFVTPIQIHTENLSAALHTKGASPKTTSFLAKRLKNSIEEYDEFVKYSCKIRNIYKKSNLKDRILEIISTEEFYLAFKSGKHEKLIDSMDL